MAMTSVFASPDPQAPSCEHPLFLERLAAGFLSPAQDYVDGSLDLNDLCIDHPTATYFLRASGESMLGAGIHPGM